MKKGLAKPSHVKAQTSHETPNVDLQAHQDEWGREDGGQLLLLACSSLLPEDGWREQALAHFVIICSHCTLKRIFSSVLLPSLMLFSSHCPNYLPCSLSFISAF